MQTSSFIFTPLIMSVCINKPSHNIAPKLALVALAKVALVYSSQKAQINKRTSMHTELQRQWNEGRGE